MIRQSLKFYLGSIFLALSLNWGICVSVSMCTPSTTWQLMGTKKFWIRGSYMQFDEMLRNRRWKCNLWSTSHIQRCICSATSQEGINGFIVFPRTAPDLRHLEISKSRLINLCNHIHITNIKFQSIPLIISLESVGKLLGTPVPV